MHQPTIEKLHALRLGAMANALTAQLQQPDIDAMPFAERLALLVDIQHSTKRQPKRLPPILSLSVSFPLKDMAGVQRGGTKAREQGSWTRIHRDAARCA